MIYAAILKNDATGRFHPILFRASPRPSDDWEPGRVCRHRSSGHHTDGFDTVDEAQGMISSEPALKDTGFVLEWDGVEIPATTLDLPMLSEREEIPAPSDPDHRPDSG